MLIRILNTCREDSFHKLLKGLRGRNEEDDLRNKRDVSRTANDLISEFKVCEND